MYYVRTFSVLELECLFFLVGIGSRSQDNGPLSGHITNDCYIYYVCASVAPVKKSFKTSVYICNE